MQVKFIDRGGRVLAVGQLTPGTILRTVHNEMQRVQLSCVPADAEVPAAEEPEAPAKGAAGKQKQPA